MAGEPISTQDERQGAAARFYTSNTSLRYPFLMRARRLALLTTPLLFRQEGASGSTQEELPWNSFGAYLVSNFAASLVFALFPPGRAPMKLKPDQAALTQLQADPNTDDDTKASLVSAINLGLAKVEQEFSDAMEEDGDRSVLTIGVLRMIVGGQQGFQFYPDGRIRGVPLERHVTRRDALGDLLGFAIMDPLSYATISPAVRAICEEKGYLPDQNKNASNQSVINVYTYGSLGEDQRWTVYEEVWGEEVPDTRRTYNKPDLPFAFTPYLLLEGEDYGRSYVESYEADIQTVEGLTQSIVEGAAALARFLLLVKPGSMTSKKAIEEAPNGAVLTGFKDDVTTPEFNKGGDFSVASSEKQDAMDRLAKAFLLNTSVQRQAERVTAEEIRYVAQELEKAQAGLYAQQVVSLQLPYATLKMKALQRGNRVTKLPSGSVKIQIIGGLAALGRNAEAEALEQAFQMLTTMFGPQALAEALGPNTVRLVAAKVFAAFGIDAQGILPSPAEAQQMDQQAQQQQMVQSLGPDAIKAIGNHLTSTAVASTNADGKVAAAQVGKGAPAPAPPPAQAALPAPNSGAPSGQ